MLFDQIALAQAAAPCVLDVAANACRPAWLSIRVPPDAAPGTYRGALQVASPSAPTIAIPIQLDIIDWKLPDPAMFQTLVGCEQNPYGVARQYGDALWGPEHFRHLDASFRQLGRIGNKWLNIPILANTEYGNRDDSMVRWIRRKDGTLAFDFALLDRYLDLAIRHCGPAARGQCHRHARDEERGRLAAAAAG